MSFLFRSHFFRKSPANRLRKKLRLQPLELRCTPATINGQVFYDVNGNGLVDSGDNGFSGVTVFLDTNNNGLLDVGAKNYASTNVPLNIPDKVGSTNGVVTSTLTISDVATASDINLKLDITHAFDGDLKVALKSPAGTSITLFSKVGSSGKNFTGTILDDQATTKISAGSAPFTGSFIPSTTLLSTFNGTAINGTWTLTVTDQGTNDTGTLNSWSLDIISAVSGGESSTTTNASGNYSFSGLSAGNYNVVHNVPASHVQTTPGGDGKYHLTLNASDTVSANFGDRLPPATITGTVFNDTNANGTKDGGEVVLSGVTVYLDIDQSGTLNAGDISTTTNGSGIYTFNNLVPNKTYNVAEVLPGGFTHIAPMSSGLIASTNVNVNKQAGEQSESAVAIDPTNPNRVFASSNNNTGSGMMGSYSTDGGATWTARYFGISGTDGLVTSTGDPNNTFDHFGNLWDVSLSSSGTSTIVYRSTDGGKTFTNFQTISSSTDQPSISIVQSATTGRDLIALIFEQASAQWASYLEVDASGPIGTFSTPVQVPGSVDNTLTPTLAGEYSDVAIGPNGEVAVAYQRSSGQGPDTIFFNLDPDGIGTTTFNARTTLTTTNVGGFDYITPQPNRSVDAEIALKWDISNGPNRGRLYAMYTEETVNENNDTDIMLRYSDNKGASWSNPVRVNDDTTTTAQFLPRMDLDPTTGYLAFTWYDARNDATNAKSEYWGTVSFDGGQTFQPNIKLSAGQSSPLGGNDYGDYSGLSFFGGTFIGCWVDNSNSTGDNPSGTASHDIYIAKVTVANNQKYWSVSTVPNTTYTGKDFAIKGANPPLTVTINQASGQADPTNGSTINYTVVFSQSVSDFATGDVSLSGTAGATSAIVTGSGTTYNVAVSGMTSSGTVIASLLAGVANGAGGANQASTSTDNTVTSDITVPTAASSPANVTSSGASSYQFTVTFSDNLAVNVGSLDNNDVRVTGPGGFDAAASFVSVDVGSNGTPRVATYSITPPGGVWDAGDNGSYSVVLKASQVADTAGNTAAGATVGSFNVNITALTVTINQENGQPDPTNSSDVNFTVVFSQAVANFATGDVALSGTAGATTAVVTGGGTTYTVVVSGMTNDGTVVATIPAGVASGVSGANQASTSTDNTITFDATPPSASSTPPSVSAAGAGSYQFTVSYSDNSAIDASLLDNGDIRVTGPGGFNVAATFVSVNVSNVATYTITPPGGTWDSSDNGSYSLVMQAFEVFDVAGNSAPSGSIASFNVNVPAAPTVTNVTFGDGTNQRSLVRQIVVTFSESVNFMGSVASAFTVHRTGTDTIGTPTGDVILTANPSNGPTSSVTVTFSGPLTEFGSLKDGLYDFTIDAAQVSGAGGALDGNNDSVPGGSYSKIGTTANKFFRLFGDSTGQGTVTQTPDFIAFRAAFNNGPSSIFDFENDGDVLQSDFVQFRARFNTTP